MFFENKKHKVVPSYSLVPSDDKSLLIVNSGMAPMKKFFLGQAKPVSDRVVTCQKCIRTPDIERVGKTSRHGTFFEMLGNFSFGDYFKKEAIFWAWEFITEDLKLPLDRLYVSVYFDDDESFDIWHKAIHIPADRIVRLGKEDNFWEIGSGPCGPCSEIYFDRGESYGCDNPDCFVGCDCDRYVEFWNLVFSQYNNDGAGNYTLMDKPNIDTGMGLERLACILQNVDNLFEIDSVRKIIDTVASMADLSYKQDEKVDISLRVITDHIRSVVFMIGDGIVPSNESRGYVLKRLLRRACIHGKNIGLDKLFLYKLVKVVAEQNRSVYPEIFDKLSYIENVVKSEESLFRKTIRNKIDFLNQLIAEAGLIDKSGERIFSGEKAFVLYDTFGFPIELTKEILAEKGIELDEAEFYRYMEDQKNKARSSRKNSSNFGENEDIDMYIPKEATIFEGYENTSCESKILNIVNESKIVESAVEGDVVDIILDRTVFYAEGGGQVGDIGTIVFGSNVVEVLDCKKNINSVYFHRCRVLKGNFNVSDSVKCMVDCNIRDSVKKNHTCAHILQFVLRDILGDGIHQAGQYVDSEKIRFDFTYFDSLTADQIKKVEQDVNKYISMALEVKISEMPIAQAKEKGAIALFGEKYGEVVRVVDISNTSVEFCGGTHVSNTIEIGLFKIISENSVASGTRRIEAVTSTKVLDLVVRYEKILSKCCKIFKVSNIADIQKKCKSLNQELKQKDDLIAKLNQTLASNKMETIFENAENISGIRVTYASFSRINGDTLRTMGDIVKQESPNMVAVLSSINEGKGILLAVCGKEAVKAGANAGAIIKEVTSLLGGKGGGRADSAMASVSEIFKIDEVLTQLSSIVQKMISFK